MADKIPVKISADIGTYSSYVDSVEISLTTEGIIINFYVNGRELITVAKTYDEWIEDENERLEEILSALARHPSDYVQGIANLQLIDGGGNNS